MSFIFRTVFWLGLALAIVPPHARLGGDEEVAFQDIDIGLELHNAAYALWSMTVQTGNLCRSNPGLCKSAAGLWDTTVTTATDLMKTADSATEEEPVKLAESRAAPHKKIQARVE